MLLVPAGVNGIIWSPKERTIEGNIIYIQGPGPVDHLYEKGPDKEELMPSSWERKDSVLFLKPKE